MAAVRQHPGFGSAPSLTKAGTINSPILPSQLWNVFASFCGTFAVLCPPLAFVCIWLIFTDNSPPRKLLPEQRPPLSACDRSGTPLPTPAFCPSSDIIAVCWSLHYALVLSGSVNKRGRWLAWHSSWRGFSALAQHPIILKTPKYCSILQPLVLPE